MGGSGTRADVARWSAAGGGKCTTPPSGLEDSANVKSLCVVERETFNDVGGGRWGGSSTVQPSFPPPRSTGNQIAAILRTYQGVVDLHLQTGNYRSVEGFSCRVLDADDLVAFGSSAPGLSSLTVEAGVAVTPGGMRVIPGAFEGLTSLKLTGCIDLVWCMEEGSRVLEERGGDEYDEVRAERKPGEAGNFKKPYTEAIWNLIKGLEGRRGGFEKLEIDIRAMGGDLGAFCLDYWVIEELYDLPFFSDGEDL